MWSALHVLICECLTPLFLVIVIIIIIIIIAIKLLIIVSSISKL